MTRFGRITAWAVLTIIALPCAAQQRPPLEHFTVTADDGHKLALWARRAAQPRGAILLIHGRTWSAIPDFDLQVPGESRSILAALAARGYAAYALDLRGYGSTPRDASGWNAPQRAADDVSEVLAWIAAHQPLATRPVLLGWSYGSMVSQLVAETHPERMSALILYGYPWNPDAPAITDSEPAMPPREHTTIDDARSDFITPGATSARAESVYVATALRTDPVRADWHDLAEWNALDAARVHVPTLLVQGQFDPSVPHDVLMHLYDRLGTSDKRWITLEGGDHVALLEKTTPTFIDAVVDFMTRP